MKLEEVKELTEKGEEEYLKKVAKELPIKDLPSIVWVPEFINPAGSLFYEREDDREPNDIDVIVRAEEKDGKFVITLDKSLRLKIDRILQERVGKKSGKWLGTEWIGSTYGPNWKYQTGWDLVLVPHEPQEIREMNEPEFAQEFYKERIGGIYLVEPHGKMIADGEKTLIVKIKELPEDYLERDVFLCSGDKVYGIIRLSRPREISQEQFEEFKQEHMISEEEAEKWGFDKKEKLYSYEFKLMDKFDLPKEYDYPKGVQTVIREVRFKKVHSRDKCMQCDSPPEYEVLWAEGRARAWFCKKHFKEWINKEPDKKDFSDINAVKEISDGMAAEKFKDNRNPNIRDRLKVEFEKLQLEEFRATGIDDDLKNPKERWRELLADLRYLGNSGYPKLKAGEKWGDWKMFDILTYYAKIVDKLRSVHFPIIAPKIGDEKYKTSYWECYRRARKYMKTKPPSEEEAKEWEKKRKKILKADNAPTFAYRAVYGKSPEMPIRGRSGGQTKEWEGLLVDAHIKDKWLDDLNSIEELEIRSTEEGKGEERPAHVIFRMADPSHDAMAENLSKELSKTDGLYSLCEIGWEGRPRIVVAGKVSYGEAGWEKWWTSLADKIKEALSRMEKQKATLFKIIKLDRKRKIVGGVIYEPNEIDTQDDYTDEKEIEKAMYLFMKKYATDARRIKINHSGKRYFFPVLEAFIPEVDTIKGGQALKKGSWWLSIHITNNKIWKMVEDGILQGFSMGGQART